MYDKGERVLRIEIIVNNVQELRCGKRLEKLPAMRERLEQMVVRFLAVVQCAHLSFVDGRQLDRLSLPTIRGNHRLAGVDLQKPRLRAVAEAVIALAPQPDGFTAEELATRVRTQQGRTMAKYNARKAAYDLRKLRGKPLVQRIAKTRRYRVRRPGIRTLAALLILREKSLSQCWPESVAPSAAARPKLSIPSTFITKLSNVKCSPPCNI
jgi:hypothetical protein